MSVLQIWRQWCHRFNFAVDALVTRRSPSVLACSSRVLQRQHIQRRPADRTSLHPLSTDLPCFQTAEMGNRENRAASVATFFLSKYRTDKHSFADLDNTKCKSASFSKFLTPLHFLQYWCTAGYTHALLHVCVFAFMFSMFFMFPLCLCEFFPGTFLIQSILELETPWRV